MLREESYAQSWVLRDDTSGGLKSSYKKLQCGCLSGTVGSHNTNTGVELHIKVHILQQNLVRAVSKGDAAHLNDRRRHLLHFWELKVH